MQRQMFFNDTYIFSCRSKQIEINRSENRTWLALEDNIFHPKGGGQPSDMGMINGNQVLDVKKNPEGVICLMLEGIPSLNAVITAEIDGCYRQLVSALHTAGHMVNSIVKSWGFTYHSCNHEPEKSRVVFDLTKEVDKTILQSSIEEEVYDLIRQNIVVNQNFSDDGVRKVHIGSIVDFCAGTHVQNTGLIENFKVRSIKTKNGKLSIGYDCNHKKPLKV